MTTPIPLPEFPNPPVVSPLDSGFDQLSNALERWRVELQQRLRMELPKLPATAVATRRTLDTVFIDALRTLRGWALDITVQSNTQVQGVGAAIVSDAEITVSSAIHHVTGSVTITTIRVPTQQVGMTSTAAVTRDRSTPAFTGPVWLWADDGFDVATGGNISAPRTYAPGETACLVFDGNNWSPVGG
jgi:hypothetical protein